MPYCKRPLSIWSEFLPVANYLFFHQVYIRIPCLLLSLNSLCKKLVCATKIKNIRLVILQCRSRSLYVGYQIRFSSCTTNSLTFYIIYVIQVLRICEITFKFDFLKIMFNNTMVFKMVIARCNVYEH